MFFFVFFRICEVSQAALAEPDMWLSCSLPAPVGIAHCFCLFLSFYSGLLFMIQGADDAPDTLNILCDKEGKSQPASENGDPSQIGQIAELPLKNGRKCHISLNMPRIHL